MTLPTDVAEALRPWFADRLGADDVALSDLRRHAEGWSWQTYTMSVEWRDAAGETRRHGYAVRREPEDGLLAPYDTVAQYRLHRAVLDNSQVPMPGLHWLEIDPGPLGMPFYVMDRVEGVVPVQWRGNDPAVFPDEAARRAVGHDFVDVLGSIHAIDPGAMGGILETPESSDAAAAAQIDRWQALYVDSRLVAVPLLEACIGWLRANVATSGRLSLVHGDYRIGNFMLGPGRRINAVFDWELAHIGDPVFDVAWAGLPLFRGRSPLLSHLLPAGEFFARYEDRTGLHIDEEVFRFWTIFGHLRASAPHVRATRAFADGRVGDLRLAAMGHQNLYILRQLAGALGWSVPRRDEDGGGRSGAGSPLQVPLERIFEGLAAALRDDVAPHLTDPYARSQAMAAIEVLGNLASRVEWSGRDQMETITGARAVLEKAPAAAPGRIQRLLEAPLPRLDDAAAVAEARAGHLAALASLQDWLSAQPGYEALRDALVGFLLEDLGAELGRLRSGMYHSRKKRDE